MNEIWKEFIFQDYCYAVSNLGKVKSFKKLVERKNGNYIQEEKILKGYISKDYGYVYVRLGKIRKSKLFTIHKLVCKYFIGGRPSRYDIRHLDGNKLNNNINNLCYGSRSENERDKIIHGRSNRGSRQGNSKLKENDVKEIINLYKNGLKIYELAKKHNVNWATIYNIIMGKSWGWLTNINKGGFYGKDCRKKITMD